MDKIKTYDISSLSPLYIIYSVPMFVLLSGIFILDPSKRFSFKKLFEHNILRLATAFPF
ncbi:hypothetical protein BCR32DRAFT_279610 [Anaeromyces robustus]|uniref:Uncharacterized protein n=1 Tax=Anaeromyces robustus TaxID=1754192 RepID=A0A1Y1X7A9_9FUNG|nr:hypothetical protein BCR32DRAFT_279610 [Anaeromyces robustus]|eukprot:ORX81612.1 hypothetical protein BCR32DRAFT_279610 [Anaeromyces robustus]